MPTGTPTTVRNVLQSLPAVDDFAGVPLTAPVLIVPRVFDFSSATFLSSFMTRSAARIPDFCST